MLAGDLLMMFRNEVLDVERPYLWSDTEAYFYMTDAYRMFVRLTGGVPDASSTLTQLAVAAGENSLDINPMITRIVRAFRASDGAEVDVINHTDVPLRRNSVTGQVELLKTTNVQCWVIPFNQGSGLVPSAGVSISNGTAVSTLIGVWLTSTGMPLVAGDVMPTSGFIKVRTPSTGAFSASPFTGISARAATVGRAGYVEEGAIEYLVLGGERLTAQVVPAPSSDETLILHVRRLPLKQMLESSDNLNDIGDEHQLHLLKWMKALAYRKQDAETFDMDKASANEASFVEYCDQSSYEFDQYKRKTRFALRSQQDALNPKRILSADRRNFNNQQNNGGVQ